MDKINISYKFIYITIRTVSFISRIDIITFKQCFSIYFQFYSSLFETMFILSIEKKPHSIARFGDVVHKIQSNQYIVLLHTLS